jgi:hypothetical protein
MSPVQEKILRVLGELLKVYPDMRFGQLVVNISNGASEIPDGLWDLEDDVLLAAAQSHLDKVQARQHVA